MVNSTCFRSIFNKQKFCCEFFKVESDITMHTEWVVRHVGSELSGRVWAFAAMFVANKFKRCLNVGRALRGDEYVPLVCVERMYDRKYRTWLFTSLAQICVVLKAWKCYRCMLQPKAYMRNHSQHMPCSLFRPSKYGAWLCNRIALNFRFSFGKETSYYL